MGLTRPRSFGGVSELGPLVNHIVRAACHKNNGRGHSRDDRTLSMLARLSIPGEDGHGAPKRRAAKCMSNQQRFVGDGSLLHRLNSYQKGEIGLIWTAIR